MGIVKSALMGFVESQVFYPERAHESDPSRWGLSFRDVWFSASDGAKLHGWFIPAPKGRHLLLFSHGNAGNISHRLDNIVRLNRVGISVFIYDYRGYGKSPGRPSHEGFLADAAGAFVAGKDLAGQINAPLSIFGRSLGGIAAVRMSAGKDPAALILESTFTHLGDMAAVHFPFPKARSLLSGLFNAVGFIGRVKAPLLFIHGDRDDIVPIKLGRALFEAANQPKKFVTIESAGHNDTYLVAGDGYFEAMLAFLDNAVSS